MKITEQELMKSVLKSPFSRLASRVATVATKHDLAVIVFPSVLLLWVRASAKKTPFATLNTTGEKQPDT